MQDFINKLKIKVKFSSFLYFYYRISLINDVFLCSNVIFHLFNCPRSNFLRNTCRDCSLCFFNFKQPSFIRDGCLSLDSNFAYESYELHKNNNFKIKIFFVNFKQKSVLESYLKRCLTLKIFQSKHDIYISFLEVFSRILFNSFYSIVEDFDEKEDCEIYLSLFHDFYEDFINFLNETNFEKDFFKKFFREFDLTNYNSNFIRIVNQKYIDIILEKRRDHDKNKTKPIRNDS